MHVLSFPSVSRRLILAAALAVSALACAYAATSASANLYIGGYSNFIQTAPTGGGKAKNLVNSRGDGIAQLAVSSRFLFWANNAGQSNVGPINRTASNGKNFKSHLVKGANSVNAVTVSGKYLYFGLNSSIGRSTLLGTAPNLNLVADTGTVMSIAVAGGYIYWSNADGSSIGRANLDGSSANPNFIAAVPGSVNDIAVNGSAIYWSNAGGTAIGTANLDGSSVNPSLISSMAQVGEIALLGNFIYWTDAGGQIGPCDGPGCIPSSPGATAGSIDRAKLNGTGVKKIVKRLNNPNTLAVTADPKR